MCIYIYTYVCVIFVLNRCYISICICKIYVIYMYIHTRVYWLVAPVFFWFPKVGRPPRERRGRRDPGWRGRGSAVGRSGSLETAGFDGHRLLGDGLEPGEESLFWICWIFFCYEYIYDTEVPEVIFFEFFLGDFGCWRSATRKELEGSSHEGLDVLSRWCEDFPLIHPLFWLSENDGKTQPTIQWFIMFRGVMNPPFSETSKHHIVDHISHHIPKNCTSHVYPCFSIFSMCKNPKSCWLKSSPEAPASHSSPSSPGRIGWCWSWEWLGIPIDLTGNFLGFWWSKWMFCWIGGTIQKTIAAIVRWVNSGNLDQFMQMRVCIYIHIHIL